METIDDIVREMREGVKDAKGNRIGLFDDFAKRVLAAYMRLDREMDELRDENARLRAALRPVVNCELNPIVSCALGIPNCELWLAIQECKRIFNESEAK